MKCSPILFAAILFAASSAIAQQHTKGFEPSAEELAAIIRLGREKEKGGPLQFEKGNGMRIVMTGHSWVAPGQASLLKIARGTGLEGHHQRYHSGGGATGSANAIWLKEFGKWKNGVEADPILIPAIATGEWDVMTWGSYYKDKPEYYIQWIDFCLKHNPEMVFYVQGGWPRFLPEYKTKTPDEILQEMKALQVSNLEEIYRPRYEPLEKLYPGKFRMIPTSFAVVELIEQFYKGELPNLDCIDEKSSGGKNGIYRDGGHLSRSSGIGHLVGYVYYGMIYRRSPALIKNYKPGNIPADFDRRMREAAWKAIVDHPLAHVDDADGDGIGDMEPAAE